MSDKIANTQDRPEEKPLTEQELQFCNLYVNGGLEYAGRPKNRFVDIAGDEKKLRQKDPFSHISLIVDRAIAFAFRLFLRPNHKHIYL